MPVFLLFALLLGFGLETPGLSNSLSRGETVARTWQVAGYVSLIALAAFLLGRWSIWRAARAGGSTASLRRRFAIGVRVLDMLILAAYGWIIHGVDWPRVVRSGYGLREWILVDDLLILLPFLLAQLAGWWGLFAAERALRPSLAGAARAGLGRHLVLKARQSLGLVLPMLLVFALGQDLVRQQWPEWSNGPLALPLGMGMTAILVLIFSPLFVRLAWPMRPLPPGPLRERLERVADRFGFRCTDILVWDTGQAVVNAGVTGSLPWFRYVLLTDALVENLSPQQIAAVFGHEIGHIAHRHLNYFGFFFLGSLGVLALYGATIDQSLLNLLERDLGLRDHPTAVMVVQALATLVVIGLYFLVVFGYVSRRFERQADVFGCRVVSCGQPDCPPHADLNGRAGPALTTTALCPVGIRIFADALSNVAALNGLEHGRRSWRHGSIARRIAFLEGLEGKPEAERRFQAAVSRLRVGVAVVLIAAMVVAVATGSLEHLR